MPKYKNVSVIQVNHQKTWFQKFRSKIGLASAAVSTSVITAAAHAEGEVTGYDFLAPAKTALSSISGDLIILYTAGMALIILMVVYAKSKGGARKA